MLIGITLAAYHSDMFDELMCIMYMIIGFRLESKSH